MFLENKEYNVLCSPLLARSTAIVVNRLKRPQFRLPTLKDITSKLVGAYYFSIMNARSGYLTVKLTEESFKLATFNTVFGQYRFLCLPFGLKSAQDESQCNVDETYKGLQGITAIVDNVLIYGQSKEKHEKKPSDHVVVLQRERVLT